MDYVWRYLQNLLIVVLAIEGLAIFVAIFYPGALKVLGWTGHFVALLNLWSLPVMVLPVSALLKCWLGGRGGRQESSAEGWLPLLVKIGQES